jgi:thiamine-monophosphate kinase
MKLDKRLGERKIIEIIENRLKPLPEMPIPFGDDVSAYDIGNGSWAVLKTDMLVDKTDVPPKMSLWQAARKAVVMNVSDFAAKGVKPLVILVSLGLPGKFAKKSSVEEIADGLDAGSREYNVYVIGGDTNESSDLVMSLSLFGMAKKNEVMLRSGACPGDIVAVTGSFGKTSAGLKILVNGLKVSPKVREVLVDSVLMPHARLQEGLALSKIKAASATIDSSDGLAWSLHELARASKVGFLIDNPPVAPEVREFAEVNKLSSLELALNGGEEYELVLAVKPKLWDKAQRAVKDVGGELLKVGRTIAEKKILMKVDGRKMEIEARGWEHFKSQ